MNFPPGKPILLLIVIAIFSGGGLMLFPPASRGPGNLVVWTFADSHAREYRAAAPRFTQLSGQRVSMEVISSQGLNSLLSSMFMSGNAANALPDAAEIEISSVGEFFRPPTVAVGFLPLNDFLEHGGYRRIRSLADPGQPGWNALHVPDSKIYVRNHGQWLAAATAGWPDWIPGTGDRVIRSLAVGGEEGWRARWEPESHVYHYDGAHWQPDPARNRPDAWIDRLLASRLAPWTKAGVIFGVPQDVNPVTITYRADLFAKAGIDLAAATTWPKFQDACLRFQAYWANKGFRDRHAIELSHQSSDDLETMLLQRHLNLIDADHISHMTDPVVLQTLLFYAQLVAGPKEIGANPAGGAGLWSADLVEGNVCAMITPDWKAQDLRLYAPSLAGKLRMMPLPRFDSSDAPTSTWGGTMIGIPRGIPPSHVERAWRLIEFLYLDPPTQTGHATDADAAIVPPLPERWNESRWHRPDPYFGSQSVGELYVQLAGNIPARVVTPTTPIAELELAAVLGRAVKYVGQHGTMGLEEYCQRLLQWSDADLRVRIAQEQFE
jgi:hypothetical protein